MDKELSVDLEMDKEFGMTKASFSSPSLGCGAIPTFVTCAKISLQLAFQGSRMQAPRPDSVSWCLGKGVQSLWGEW